MKSYLDLISISYKVHRKHSRMTRFCIILAVFLVTAIFGMADMEIRSMNAQAKWNYGEWHAALKGMDDEQAEMVAKWPEVYACSRYNTLNYRLSLDYQVEGKKVVMAGFDESALDIFPSLKITEGSFPSEPGEVMVDENMQKQLGLSMNDKIVLTTPEKSEKVYVISGFTENFPMLMKNDVYGLMMNMDDFRQLSQKGAEDNYDSILYIRFSKWCNIQKIISRMQKQFQLSDDRISRNEMLLATMAQSRDSTIIYFYAAAAVLAALVSIAGILMITGSLNSNVTQRTEFFGMLRCLGATRKQVIRFVRKEALGWCKDAVPIGLLAGTVLIWILCAVLKILSPKYFVGMPDFGISFIGIVCGAVIGVLTVVLAAGTPAKKAAEVSPLTAVSGNADFKATVKKAANTKFLKIDAALGIHHAMGRKKNFFLMTGSFAFSIILFLAFTTVIDFINHALTPLRPYKPDVSIVSEDNTCSLDQDLVKKLAEIPNMKRVYGRMFAYDIPAWSEEKQMTVNLISYEEFQFGWAEDSLIEGSLEEAERGEGVLAVYSQNNPIEAGDAITADFGNDIRKVNIVGVLSNCPFDMNNEDSILICSEKLFQSITGEKDYTIIDMQLEKDADDETIEEIRVLAGDNIKLSDMRMDNAQAKGAYMAFSLFVYGFLTVIAMIAVFNIINSIAMSVYARMKQYGVMRAIGMDSGQLLNMIAAEAITYGICGIATGCILGLPINRFLYQQMVTRRWGESWYFPVSSMGIIVLIVIFAVLLAIIKPAKEIRNMSVTEVISWH